MKVDRCVCLPISFQRLKSIAEVDRLDFDGLKARTRCCMSCKMCEPYVRRMLTTGETEFVLDRKNPAPVAGAPVSWTSVSISRGKSAPPNKC